MDHDRVFHVLTLVAGAVVGAAVELETTRSAFALRVITADDYLAGLVLGAFGGWICSEGLLRLLGKKSAALITMGIGVLVPWLALVAPTYVDGPRMAVGAVGALMAAAGWQLRRTEYP